MEAKQSSPQVYQKLTTMHRMLSMLGEDEATEIMIQQLDRAETNADFLANLGK